MEVKQAVAFAKNQILDLFENENPTNVGLEEIEFDAQNDEWHVTIGFSRPWDEPRNSLAALASASISLPRRVYKVVTLSNHTGDVLSVKNRET